MNYVVTPAQRRRQGRREYQQQRGGLLGLCDQRTHVTNPAEVNGSVEVADNGSPQALVGQVTTLSAITGLNFDSPFLQRQAAW